MTSQTAAITQERARKMQQTLEFVLELALKTRRALPKGDDGAQTADVSKALGVIVLAASKAIRTSPVSGQSPQPQLRPEPAQGEAPIGSPAPVACPTASPVPDHHVGLTDRQAQTLDCIRGSVRERGYPPSLRELCQAMNIKSATGVRHHLLALEKKGVIRRDHNRSRSITLIVS